MQGPFGEIEGKTRIGGYIVELSSYGGSMKKYRRIKIEDKSTVASAVLPGDTVLLLEPATPVFLPHQYESEAVMIRFTEPVFVTPGSEASFYLTAPVDYVVYDEDGEIVDIFALENPKYGLYGDPAEGVVCRYTRSNVHPEPVNPEPGRALVPVRVRNSYSATLKMTLVVIPHRMIKIYYSGEGTVFYSVVKVELEDTSKAVVISDKLPPSRNLKPSRVDPFKRKGTFIPIEVGRFELEWGFSIPLTRLTPQS